MIRRLLVAAAAALVLLTPVERAAAHTDTCVFQGLMTTSSPPNIGVTTQWFMTITVGTCVTSFPFAATGDMTGSMLATTTGTGVTNTGHRFAFTGAGGTVELAGEVVGVFVFTPDVTVPSGGTRFFVNAAIELLH